MAERATSNIQLDDKITDKWRADYLHPLLLTSSDHAEERAAYQVWRLDSWKQFVSNPHINDILLENMR